MILRLLIILLMAGSILAEYVPSGSHTYYNATVDSTKIYGGGPPRNYFHEGQWREIKTEFRQQGNWLISDSGLHSVGVNLITNILWAEWNGHYLGLEIGPLYAFRRTTHSRTKLADPSFTNRSYQGEKLTVQDIYPGVDLEIINDPTNIHHRYIFHQSARNAFENWWQNNGAYSDIYIVNAIKLRTDSLNLTVIDNGGVVNLQNDKDVLGLLRFKAGTSELFNLRQGQLAHDTAALYDEIYKRLVNIGEALYLLEGFKWLTVRDWPDGDVAHYATFGNTGDFTSQNTIADGMAVVYRALTGAAGTADYIHFRYRDRGTDDTVNLMVYTDDGDATPEPVDIVAFSKLDANSAATIWDSVAISFTVDASTQYFLGVQNIGGSTTTEYYNNDVSDSAWGATTYADAGDVPDDPWVGGTILLRRQFKRALYVSYTVSGGPPTETRRRALLLRSVE